MSKTRIRYEDFADRINVEAFEEAIEWTPEYEVNGNDVGFCPWPENHAHGDTTGKFGIHREKRVYNCYVCGGGSLLSLTMELKDLDMDDALRWLYQFCEEDLRTDAEFEAEFLSAFEDVQTRVETLPYFNARVLEKYTEPIPEWWLDERFIAANVAEEYGVKYSSTLTRRAPPKGKYADDEDYVGPGVIFPHYWQGKLVGWQTRWLDDDRPDWIPKYTNTTDFPREHTIWGYEPARKAAGPIVVIESVPSALFAITTDYSAVATFGSSATEAQLRLLKRFTQGVILVPDNDPVKEPGKLSAGYKWRLNLTKYLKKYTDVWWVPQVGPNPKDDLGDLAKANDPFTAMDELMDQKFLPGIDFK